jgi:predicted acyl esterase
MERLGSSHQPESRASVTSGVVIEAGIARRFNVRIPLSDGITLSADLALPRALPAPVVVVRTPYGKAGERNSQHAAMFAETEGVIATNRLWHTPARPSRLILN